MESHIKHSLVEMTQFCYSVFHILQTPNKFYFHKDTHHTVQLLLQEHQLATQNKYVNIVASHKRATEGGSSNYLIRQVIPPMSSDVLK